MITKELLSEVLANGVVTKICDLYGSELFYCSDKEQYPPLPYSMNIHELAHKCKEWALEQGYFLYSVIVDKEAYAFVTYPCNTSLRLFSNHSKTEPEAIFKACEWISSEVRNGKEKK